jgi:hypothetical protein
MVTSNNRRKKGSPEPRSAEKQQATTEFYDSDFLFRSTSSDENEVPRIRIRKLNVIKNGINGMASRRVTATKSLAASRKSTPSRRHEVDPFEFDSSDDDDDPKQPPRRVKDAPRAKKWSKDGSRADKGDGKTSVVAARRQALSAAVRKSGPGVEQRLSQTLKAPASLGTISFQKPRAMLTLSSPMKRATARQSDCSDSRISHRKSKVSPQEDVFEFLLHSSSDDEVPRKHIRVKKISPEPPAEKQATDYDSEFLLHSSSDDEVPRNNKRLKKVSPEPPATEKHPKEYDSEFLLRSSSDDEIPRVRIRKWSAAKNGNGMASATRVTIKSPAVSLKSASRRNVDILEFDSSTDADAPKCVPLLKAAHREKLSNGCYQGDGKKCSMQTARQSGPGAQLLSSKLREAAPLKAGTSAGTTTISRDPRAMGTHSSSLKPAARRFDFPDSISDRKPNVSPGKTLRTRYLSSSIDTELEVFSPSIASTVTNPRPSKVVSEHKPHTQKASSSSPLCRTKLHATKFNKRDVKWEQKSSVKEDATTGTNVDESLWIDHTFDKQPDRRYDRKRKVPELNDASPNETVNIYEPCLSKFHETDIHIQLVKLHRINDQVVEQKIMYQCGGESAFFAKRFDDMFPPLFQFIPLRVDCTAAYESIYKKCDELHALQTRYIASVALLENESNDEEYTSDDEEGSRSDGAGTAKDHDYE